jgi:hypothetical protein
MDTGQWMVIGLSAVFLLWILIGSVANRKRAEQVLSWVQEGTKPLGRLSGARRLKGSAVQLTIKDAITPFRHVDLIFALEPRENPPLWIYNRLGGRRDELIIKTNLRLAPKEEFSVVQGKAIVPVASAGLNSFLVKYAGALQRLSIQRASPHVMVHLHLAPVLAIAPIEFFEDLQGLTSTDEGETGK